MSLSICIAIGFLGQIGGFVPDLGIAPAQILPLSVPDQSMEDWVTVTYLAGPQGPVLFEEPGEQVWRIQDHRLLLLGASGLALPDVVLARRTVFVVVHDSTGSWGPYQLFPQRDALAVQGDAEHITKQLFASLPGVDTAYLVQVAHFLAGNLATLEVLGTSFAIPGKGTVIDSNANWTGGRLEILRPSVSVFLGQASGQNDDGTLKQNTGLGFQALKAITTGSGNTAVGHNTLLANTTGIRNVAVGFETLSANISGQANVGMGYRSLYKLSSAENNVAMGDQALYNLTTGNFNTGIGTGTMDVLTIGTNNTAIGAYAGPSTGFGNIVNSTALGAGATVSNNNMVRVGNTSVISIGGQVAWSTLSDGRFKRKVVENVPGLAFIMKLRPLTYEVDQPALVQFMGKGPATTDSHERQSGFIAQEVDQVAESLGFSFSGVDRPENAETPYALRYGAFVTPLVKAVQEQQALIEDLQARITRLESRLAVQEQP
ncbi:MAG: tail fiber domain-containing protein [Acidobacteria bacterium]|nr:tail fiber domain-containing protein [Acidobacteriota bacterium]